MKIEDYGIVLSTSKFGDSSLLVKILSKEHGPVKGLVKGQRKNGTIIQCGNYVHFTWSARLSEHLGLIAPTLERAYPLLCFSEYTKILSISSLCSLVDSLIPDREVSLDIFERFKAYLDDINTENWLKNHVLLELYILEKVGFGLDFERCSVTGTQNNVTYISPKTGSAVSKEVGEPYKSRLFPIPSYFFEAAENLPHSMKEVIDGLEITRYFLAKHFFAESLARMPASFVQFRDEMNRMFDVEKRENRDYQFSGSSQ